MKKTGDTCTHTAGWGLGCRWGLVCVHHDTCSAKGYRSLWRIHLFTYSAIAAPQLMLQGSKVRDPVESMVQEEMARLWEQWQHAATSSMAKNESPTTTKFSHACRLSI
jgi:hypothetical protein